MSTSGRTDTQSHFLNGRYNIFKVAGYVQSIYVHVYSMIVLHVFRYDLIEPKDQKWGSLEGNNYTFNGLIGQVQRLVISFKVLLFQNIPPKSTNMPTIKDKAENVKHIYTTYLDYPNSFK